MSPWRGATITLTLALSRIDQIITRSSIFGQKQAGRVAWRTCENCDHHRLLPACVSISPPRMPSALSRMSCVPSPPAPPPPRPRNVCRVRRADICRWTATLDVVELRVQALFACCRLSLQGCLGEGHGIGGGGQMGGYRPPRTLESCRPLSE
ncbi:hypothetical protein LZ30DRAFT_442569 [Colletotrichum cereale]|nr:hypothetical protein LZ30DRAFT_442569 [Colletotrichum cereale]